MNAKTAYPAARQTGTRHRTSRNVCSFAGLEGDTERATVGWLLFDAACPFCSRLAHKIRPLLGRRGIEALPLQTAWVKELLAERNEPLLKEIRFLDARGRLTGGADALIEVADRIWWSRPAAWLASVPPLRRIARHFYEIVAKRRHCLTGKSWSEYSRRVLSSSL